MSHLTQLQNVRKLPLFAILVAIFDPEKLTWCHVHGHNFAVPEDIATKILQDLRWILATPPDNFTPNGEVSAEKTVT